MWQWDRTDWYWGWGKNGLVMLLRVLGNGVEMRFSHTGVCVTLTLHILFFFI